jgi:hypothetical protein
MNESYTARFEMIGDHSHNDTHRGNKWHGINNYSPMTGFGDGQGTVNHRITGYYFDGMSSFQGGNWGNDACTHIEPDGPHVNDNENWACTSDVSNDDEDVSRHYIVKGVYAINSTNLEDTNDYYLPANSLMNYVLTLGSAWEFMQYDEKFNDEPLGGIMPFCKDHTGFSGNSEYMPDCTPAEYWGPDDRNQYCYEPGKANFYNGMVAWK